MEFIGSTKRYKLAAEDKERYYPHVNWVIVGSTRVDVLKEHIQRHHMIHSTFESSDETMIYVSDDFLGLPGEQQSNFTFSKVTGRLVDMSVQGECEPEKFDALRGALKETYATEGNCFLSSGCKIYYTFPLTEKELKDSMLNVQDLGPRLVLSQENNPKNPKVEYRLSIFNKAGNMVEDDEISNIIKTLDKSRKERVGEVKKLFN